MPAVQTLEDFKLFVRYNKFKTDPCQKNDPGRAIASRYDLRIDSIDNKHNSSLMGCTDSKVTNLAMSKSFQFIFLVGPIHDVENGIPFFSFVGEALIHPEKVIPDGTWMVLPSVWSDVIGCGNATCITYPEINDDP